MSPLTTDQIRSLAPDDASLKAAQGLAKPGKWVTLGAFTGGLWGECQGSGSKPYQVMVDANGLGTKCSCPSRKFPCKHGLGLMLMYTSRLGTFGETPTAWMTEWLDGRAERAEKQAAKRDAAATAPPPDPEKVAKRQEARLDKMRVGGQFLSLWMRDLVRDGISDLKARPSSFWRDVAARMVDTQCPGLARSVENLEFLAYCGLPNWPELFVAQLGRVQLLLDALERFATLPDALQNDVKTSLGWPQEKESALTGEKVEDHWTVAGIVFRESGLQHERRVWLLGKSSNRAALLLDFSHGGRKFENAFTLGSQEPATLGFYPSALPSRAVVVSLHGASESLQRMPQAQSWNESLETY
jgi:hypothetical protein